MAGYGEEGFAALGSALRRMVDPQARQRYAEEERIQDLRRQQELQTLEQQTADRTSYYKEREKRGGVAYKKPEVGDTSSRAAAVLGATAGGALAGPVGAALGYYGAGRATNKPEDAPGVIESALAPIGAPVGRAILGPASSGIMASQPVRQAIGNIVGAVAAQEGGKALDKQLEAPPTVETPKQAPIVAQAASGVSTSLPQGEGGFYDDQSGLLKGVMQQQQAPEESQSTAGVTAMATQSPYTPVKEQRAVATEAAAHEERLNNLWNEYEFNMKYAATVPEAAKRMQDMRPLIDHYATKLMASQTRQQTHAKEESDYAGRFAQMLMQEGGREDIPAEQKQQHLSSLYKGGRDQMLQYVTSHIKEMRPDFSDDAAIALADKQLTTEGFPPNFSGNTEDMGRMAAVFSQHSTDAMIKSTMIGINRAQINANGVHAKLVGYDTQLQIAQKRLEAALAKARSGGRSGGGGKGGSSSVAEYKADVSSLTSEVNALGRNITTLNQEIVTNQKNADMLPKGEKRDMALQQLDELRQARDKFQSQHATMQKQLSDLRTLGAVESGKRKGAPKEGVQTSTPVMAPAGAIEHLKKNPALATQFDAKYGAGASKQILGK